MVKVYAAIFSSKQVQRSLPGNYDTLRRLFDSEDTLVVAMSFAMKTYKFASIFGSQAAWHRMENGPGPNAENGETLADKLKMAHGPNREKWPENGGEKNYFISFSPLLGLFFPISGCGPLSFSQPILSHFWLSARSPFCTRRSDSQFYLPRFPIARYSKISGKKKAHKLLAHKLLEKAVDPGQAAG